MKRQLLIYAASVALLFPACENELPFRDKPQAPGLLMNAFLEAGQAKNEISLFIIDGDESIPVSDGFVTLYVNGEKQEEAEVYRGTYTSYCTLESPLRGGDRIMLEATVEEGKYTGRAEVQVPLPIEDPIRVDTLRTPLKVGSTMEDCLRYRIAIHDRPSEKNYYQLVIETHTHRTIPEGETYTEVEPLEIYNQEDIVLTDGHLTSSDDDEFGILDMTVRNVRNVFTDSRFTDGSYTLNVYTYYPAFWSWSDDWKNRIEVDVVIRLLSITEAQFRYLRAMNCLDSEDYIETFMEPVIVPQNVSGGLGFVGASSEQQVVLRVFEREPYVRQ